MDKLDHMDKIDNIDNMAKWTNVKLDDFGQHGQIEHYGLN